MFCSDVKASAAITGLTARRLPAPIPARIWPAFQTSPAHKSKKTLGRFLIAQRAIKKEACHRSVVICPLFRRFTKA